MTKTNRPSVLSALIFSVCAIVAVPAARAQLTFTVNEFTTNKLVLTLNPGTLLTINGASFSNALFLVDGIGTNTGWINFDVYDGGTGGAFGSLTQVASYALTDTFDGCGIMLQWDGDLSTAGNLVTGLTYTFEGTNLFSPLNVSTWALYWGAPSFPPATLQSTGSAVTGGGSAPIPEPSAFAALAGLAVLGLAATRRRQRA